MTYERGDTQDVELFLARVGLEQTGHETDIECDVRSVQRISEKARASDVYRRSLARACLLELQSGRAA